VELHSFCNEYLEFFNKEHISASHVNETWSKSSPGYLKINIGGSYWKDVNLGGWGFVVRNDQGEGIAAGAGFIAAVASPLQSEAIPCLKALNFASNQGMMTLEIETDYKCLRDALTSNDWDDSHDGVIIRELKFLILSYFNDVKVLFAPRMCNKVAHHLAVLIVKS
jgi:hypothetical protein